jgi:hypothetical protein
MSEFLEFFLLDHWKCAFDVRLVEARLTIFLCAQIGETAVCKYVSM